MTILSVRYVARQYAFHPNTIRAWVNENGLRHYRKGRGGKIYIREDDVQDYIARNYKLENIPCKLAY
ncbi:helix-turn-helix domain-containing protein [Chloroflexota bacterium]